MVVICQQKLLGSRHVSAKLSRIMVARPRRSEAVASRRATVARNLWRAIEEYNRTHTDQIPIGDWLSHVFDNDPTIPSRKRRGGSGRPLEKIDVLKLQDYARRANVTVSSLLGESLVELTPREREEARSMLTRLLEMLAEKESDGGGRETAAPVTPPVGDDSPNYISTEAGARETGSDAESTAPPTTTPSTEHGRHRDETT